MDDRSPPTTSLATSAVLPRAAPSVIAHGAGAGSEPWQAAEELEGRAPVRPLHDLRVRLVGVPLLGVTIPQVTGLFGPLRPSSPAYWAGFFYFILLSLLIWQGNRYLLIKQRARLDWLDAPVRKAVTLIVASIFYTVPLTVAMLVGWYRAAGFPTVDWVAVRTVTIIVLTCVIFVTHVYETVHLIHQRSQDALRVERLERARVEAELEALRSQVDPHFLFNSLNTLAHLVETRSAHALLYTERLADLYRYILLNRGRALVSVRDELEFLDTYYQLIRLQYGDALVVTVTGDRARLDDRWLPPISLQVLLENAVKHNTISPQTPFAVRVVFDHATASVENLRVARRQEPRTSRLGLQNLDARCRLVVHVGIEIDATAERFLVRIPLVRRD